MNEERIDAGGAILPATELRDLTPEQLGGEIRLLTAQARRMALSYGIQIGYRLRVAHEKVGPHGWAEWLARETEFSAAAASRFEKLYEGYGADQGSIFGVGNKFPTLEKISISNALRLLAVPEEERETVAVELDAEHISTRELEKALRERDEAIESAREAREAVEGLRAARDTSLDDARKEAEDLRKKLHKAVNDADGLMADAEKLEAERDKLSRRVKELESRPIEVAVEKDPEAQKEIETLRKKLISAESGANVAAALFSMAQQNFNSALEKVTAMKATHPDVAAKLLAGMESVLTGLAEKVKEARGC